MERQEAVLLPKIFVNRSSSCFLVKPLFLAPSSCVVFLDSQLTSLVLGIELLVWPGLGDLEDHVHQQVCPSNKVINEAFKHIEGLTRIGHHKSLEEVIDDETVQNTLTKSETIQK